MNFTLTDAVLVALISAVITLAGRLLDGYVARRRWPTERKVAEADMAGVIAAAASQLADDQRESIRAQREEIGELKNQLRVTDGDMARYRQDLEQLTARIHKVDQERDRLQNELKQLRAENVELKKRDAVLTSRIRHLEKIIKLAGLDTNGEDNGSTA